MIKDYGDAAQQFSVNRAPAEYVISIDAMTIELPREPGHSMFFGFFAQICLYELANMHCCLNIGMSVPP